MSILELFLHKKCTHERLGYNVEHGYCPDCGEYVENRWYLTRCSCCGLKRAAITKGHEIMPAEYYCSNCGESGYYIEELKKLNFIDINFATVLKVCPQDTKENYIQTWVQNDFYKQKLLAAG